MGLMVSKEFDYEKLRREVVRDLEINPPPRPLKEVDEEARQEIHHKLKVKAPITQQVLRQMEAERKVCQIKLIEESNTRKPGQPKLFDEILFPLQKQEQREIKYANPAEGRPRPSPLDPPPKRRKVKTGWGPNKNLSRKEYAVDVNLYIQQKKVDEINSIMAQAEENGLNSRWRQET